MSHTQKLKIARESLDNAIKDVEEAQATWSEAVTTLHMAEIKLKAAQRKMRQSY